MSRPLIYLKRFLQWFFKSWIIIKQLLKFNTTHQWNTWKSERRRLFLGYNDFSSFPPPRQNSMILNIYNSTVMFFFLSSFNLSGPWYTALITLLLFSLSVVSDSLRPHRLQHARLSCSPPSPGACSNSCPLNQRFHPTIRSSVILFSSGLNLSSIRVFSNESAFRIRWPKYWNCSFRSVLTMNIRDWFPLGLTGLNSLQSNRFSTVFSNTTVQKHQFFRAQLSL